MVDINQVKDAYREGRFDQMWQVVLEISRAGHDEVSVECLSFLGTITVPEVEQLFLLFDRFANTANPDVRAALRKNLEELAQRHEPFRTRIYEKLLEYSKRWDGIDAKTRVILNSALRENWAQLSLVEKLVLKSMADGKGPFDADSVADGLDSLEGVLHPIEVRPVLERLVRLGILEHHANGTWSFVDAEERLWLAKRVRVVDVLREHHEDFLRSITLEGFAATSRRLRGSAWPTFDEVLAALDIDRQRWEWAEKHTELLRAWKEDVSGIVRAGSPARGELLSDVFHRWAELLGIRVLSLGMAGVSHVFTGKKLGKRNPKLTNLTLIAAHGPRLDGVAVQLLEDWIAHEEYARQIFVIFAFHATEDFRQAVARSIYDIVLIDERDQVALALDARGEERFMSLVVRQLDLESLSPYETAAPVREMFFGRSQILKEVLRSEKGYAIVDTRRMGKTSLLYRIHDEMKKDPANRVLFLECGGVRDNVALCRRVNTALGLTRSPVNSVKQFGALLAQSCVESGRRLVLFLDEIDNLLACDPQAEDLFQVFKSLALEGRLRVYVAGFRELFSRFRDYESLFFNFLIFQKLGNLDRRSAVALVTDPMEELGFEFDDRDPLVERVLQITSLHPNQIQIFCNLLLHTMAGKRRKRIVASDIEEVGRLPEFEDGIIRIMNSNLVHPLEKLILSLIVYYEAYPITPQRIVDLLAEWEIQVAFSDVEVMLEKLVLYAVLERKDQAYGFAHPYFPTILKKRDVQSLVEHYAQELHAASTGKWASRHGQAPEEEGIDLE